MYSGGQINCNNGETYIIKICVPLFKNVINQLAYTETHVVTT